MSAKLEAQAPPRESLRRPLPPLVGLPSRKLPVGQSVVLRGVAPDRALDEIRDLLGADGFRVDLYPAADGGAPSRTSVGIAERHVRVGPTSAAGIESVAALMGAGLTLGTIEGLLTGNLAYALPWVLGGIVLSVVFWARYGRTFDSEIIVVQIRPGSAPAGATDVARSGPGVGSAVFSAARVRSDLHGGERAAVRVIDCPQPLILELASAVRRFESRTGSVASGAS
jgi:hypothetical protein